MSGRQIRKRMIGGDCRRYLYDFVVVAQGPVPVLSITILMITANSGMMSSSSSSLLDCFQAAVSYFSSTPDALSL